MMDALWQHPADRPVGRCTTSGKNEQATIMSGAGVLGTYASRAERTDS